MGPWAPWHRLPGAAGTPVRAAGDGVVAFAGGIAGGLHVAVDHPDGLRTSYAYLARLDVSGASASDGATSSGSRRIRPGPRADVVHFGVRRRGRYVDPATLVTAPPVRVRLAPLDADPPPLCWPEAGSPPAATLSGQPGFEPEIHTPASHRYVVPRGRASSGRRSNRGTKENVAWPSSR